MATTTSKFLLVPHRSVHHAEHSGSDSLVRYMPGMIIPITSKGYLPWRIKKILARRAQENYGVLGITKEISILQQMLKTRSGVVYFLHGEHDYCYTGYWANFLKWKVVAGFHSPPDKLKKTFSSVHWNTFRKLDAVFAVGSNQIEYLKSVLKHNRIWLVPHGIDTEFFTPTDRIWRRPKLLFVGQHLRDFDTLNRVATELFAYIPDLEITAILREDYVHFITNPSIRCLSNVDDVTLREQYRTASALLLPLIDTTACNSILEALACGLPIVTTDVGGVRDYVDKECAFICKPKATDEIVDSCRKLIEDKQLNSRMRQSARQKGETFAWECIVEKILGIFQEKLGINIAPDIYRQ